MSTTEVYLGEKYCTRGIEYSPDKMLVCVNEEESFYLLDRAKKAPLSKVKWNSVGSSFNFEVFAIPGFDLKKLPFLLLRDDYSIKVFNVITQKLMTLKEAPYASRHGKIYKTMDLLCDESGEFEAVYLVTDSNEELQATHIHRVTFSEQLVSALRQMAAV